MIKFRLQQKRSPNEGERAFFGILMMVAGGFWTLLSIAFVTMFVLGARGPTLIFLPFIAIIGAFSLGIGILIFLLGRWSLRRDQPTPGP